MKLLLLCLSLGLLLSRTGAVHASIDDTTPVAGSSEQTSATGQRKLSLKCTVNLMKCRRELKGLESDCDAVSGGGGGVVTGILNTLFSSIDVNSVGDILTDFFGAILGNGEGSRRRQLDLDLGIKDKCEDRLEACQEDVDNFECVVPTTAPTTTPTLRPATASPTTSPTVASTSSPTGGPTTAPLNTPTMSPVVAPTTSPVTPTTRPVAPTTSPVAPTANPVTPTTSPVAPTASPVTPTASPVTPTTSPVAPTTSPVSPTTSPVAPTTSPVTSTSSPVEATPVSLSPALVSCVSSEAELQAAVASASTDVTVTTSIVLCGDLPLSAEIVMDNMYLEISCAVSLCDITGDSSSRLFRGTPANAKFMDLRFEDGAQAGGLGGAIFVEGGTVEIHRCTFTGNRADRGGAVYANPGSSVQFSNCLFSLNTATRQAGALYMNEASLTVTGSTFSDNTADANGGAIYMQKGSLQVTDTDFLSNDAGFSGGAVFGFSAIGTMQESRFFRNTAALENGGGGGFLSNACKISLSGCTFSENEANNGAALLIEDDSNPNLTGSWIVCGGTSGDPATTFCSGLTSVAEFVGGSTDIVGTGSFANTNCAAVGVSGTPGTTPCP